MGGLVPLTTTDYPGQLAAVVFFQGCSWRCGYCQNAHLIPVAGETSLDWADVLAFLQRRQGLLDGVVFSGGEPTLQAGLEEAVREVRQLGFKVGLHTAGIYPDRLARLLPLLDWVGLDVKASFIDYDKITRVSGSGIRAMESLRLVLESGIAYELRTTVHPTLLDQAALCRVARELAEIGASNWVLQEFRGQGCLEQSLGAQSVKGFLDEDVRQRLATEFPNLSIRYA